MNGAAPILAMLWENWRLTRIEAAQRLVLGLILGSAALAFLGDKGPSPAFWTLVALHSMIWFSIAKLNGGRFADGYKPGFPFHLLYRAPVSTATFVGVAMAYDAITCTALYLVSAALLGFAFEKSLPLFSMAVCLISYHLAYACCQWSTRNRIVQWGGSVVFSVPVALVLLDNVSPTLEFGLSVVENAAFVLLGVASVWLTIAGVARQRCGDSAAFEPRMVMTSGEYPGWLISLFHFRCPTSSAIRAQIWFELRSSGLPALMIGLGVAVLMFLLTVLSIFSEPVRVVAVVAGVLVTPLMLFAVGGNAFGIRNKQAHRYVSAFEMTLPCTTDRLSSIKLLVRTACVLIALAAIGTSLWASSSLIGAWGQWGVQGQDALPGLLKARQKLAEVFAALPAYAYAVIALLASFAVAQLIAWQAAREALRVRYRRQLIIGNSATFLWGVATIVLALAHAKEIVEVGVVRQYFIVSFWSSGVVIALSAIYILRRGLVERALTARYAFGAVLIAAATFAMAWFASTPAPGIVALLWLAMLILMVSLLAPWALSRARHA